MQNDLETSSQFKILWTNVIRNHNQILRFDFDLAKTEFEFTLPWKLQYSDCLG